MPRQIQYAPVNGDVLRWARETRGYTVDRAAERLNITPAELSSIEAGDAEPRLGLFSAMTRVYKRSQGVLLSPERPETEPLPTDFRTLEGSPAKLSPEALMAIRDTRALQRFITRLVGLENELLPAVNLPSASHSDSPEQIGEAERERFGVSVESQYRAGNNARALQGWRVRLQEMGVFVAVRSVDLKDFRGFSFRSPIVPMITVSSQDSEAGRSFTLFHEYAHLLLGEEGSCIPGSASSFGIRSEAWCNRFSAAFLMPEDAVRRRASDLFRHLEPEDWDGTHAHVIATYFRVSDFVAALRLDRVGITDVFERMTNELYARDYKRSGGGGGGETRVEKRARENGFAITSAVLRGARADLVDFGEASEILKLSADQFVELETLVSDQHQNQSF